MKQSCLFSRADRKTKVNPSKHDLKEKLSLLSRAARYDASCASSDSHRKTSAGIGATHQSGICHSWSADGRCISLLKVLFCNACRLDCVYCGNRYSNNHQRVSFSPEELAQLTIDFYRRNYIEGLFLSSAIFASPDDTMLALLRTVKLLRHKHLFQGYIHLKAIPGASPELIAEGALLADRMSANIELPSRQSLKLLAPDKNEGDILKVFYQATQTDILPVKVKTKAGKDRRKPTSGGIGMATQMIIGASPDNDRVILEKIGRLYKIKALKRIYYSAYIPVNSDDRLPASKAAPPLLREHRLFQADWLLRFYHFNADEILAGNQGFLDTDVDPKTAWALRHMDLFPVNINSACKEELLRIPGVGLRSCARILRARRFGNIKLDELKRLGVVIRRARHFVHDGTRGPKSSPSEKEIRNLLIQPRHQQLSFEFGLPTETTMSALSGEL